jgi:carboxyl-terminal processing protease
MPMETLRALANSVDALHESYVKPISNEELLQAAIRGMVREIDPNGDVLTLSEIKAAPSTANGIGGVGLQIKARDGYVVVVTPLSGSPAQTAGIQPQDVLVSIDGVPVGARINWAVKALRGPLDSLVEVGIRPASANGVRTLRMKRERVQLPTAQLSMKGDRIALLVVPSFAAGTVATVAKELAAQWQVRPFGALVIDLRHNQGGLLDTSVGLASLFLPPKAVIGKIEGRTATMNKVLLADSNRYGGGASVPELPPDFRRMPIVVLVDEGTAASAELFASALRDNSRARIVGRTTFGNASIQVIQPVGDGLAIKYTTAQWYPPSHQNLDRVGITPDVMTSGRSEKAELDTAVSEARRMSTQSTDSKP